MKAYGLMVPLLLAAAPAGAQVVSGSVRGFNEGVAHATVSIVNAEGIVVAHRVTDRSGSFTANVPIGGVYRVRVLAEDYHAGGSTVRVRDDGIATTRVYLTPRTSSWNHMDGAREGLHNDRLPKRDIGGGRGGGGGGGKPGGAGSET